MIILLLCFIILTAIMEAGYFHIRNVSGIKFQHEHTYLTGMRLAVYLMFLIECGWIQAIGMTLLFPLLHDGIYYTTRNHITPGIYPLGFADYSSESTAVFSLKFRWRVLFGILGILLFFLT